MRTRRSLRSRSTASVVLLIACAALVAAYWVLRYRASAIDGDAARLTLAGEGTALYGRLVNPSAYQVGFGYPVELAFLSLCAAVSVQGVQLFAGCWLVVLILSAFICYRELLGQTEVAMLGAFLLLLQPNFLFFVLRSSHEKMTWLCELLLLFFLARSYRFAKAPVRVLAHVLAFYVAFFAMVASNIFFASTIFAALALSFSLGWVLIVILRRRAEGGADRLGLQRLLIVSASCTIVAFVFVHYLYSPALGFYQTLSGAANQVSTMFLGAEPVEQPYTQASGLYARPLTYLLLTAGQWLITLWSVPAWLMQGRALIRSKWDTSAGRTWLLWLMYAGFAAQLVIAAVVDFSGWMGATLQVRLFTPFTIISAPLAARFLFQVFEWVRGRWQTVLRLAMAAFLMYGLVASLLKSTNDPVTGENWLFYSPRELSAAEWTDGHVQYGRVWMDIGWHLRDVLQFWKGSTWTSTNEYYCGTGLQSGTMSHIFISRLTRLQANRLGLPLPSVVDYSRVYDNGDAQLYARRPRTPYQE